MANGTSKEKETELLQEISKQYTKLNQIREKRAKEAALQDHTSSILNPASKESRRVILVTRNLPFKLSSAPKGEDTNLLFKAEFPNTFTLDGSVENFMTLHDNFNSVWVGSVVGDIESSEQHTVKNQLLQDRNYFPVFLDSKKEKLFYNGYCKSVMWPLFHSVPPTTEDQLNSHDSEGEDQTEKMWQAYVSVNQAFADAIQEIYEEGDLIWVQGYHLALLPQMLRSLFPNNNLQIGFFMHTPFPSSELYRVLNHREEVLGGILGADLVGFQTYEYARHFQSAVVRILGLESNHKGVDYNGHFSRITICPVGIDAERYAEMVRSDAVQERIEKLKEQFAGKKVMLGVDQLDLTKGLVHKFLAVEELFSGQPELSEKVSFVQIVAPPAEKAESELGSQVESLASRINSKLQDVGQEGPIQYLSKEIPTEALIALYCVADVFVITPVRDGMNVVPFEYVVCREAVGKHSQVILSEFAGSAQSLGGATIVNPWNTEEVHDALLNSLKDSDEVMQTHQQMYSYVSNFTSRKWADNFLEQLQESHTDSAISVPSRELSRRDMSSAYMRSHRRLIFINYEGVLASESSIPELAYPPQELIWQLKMLVKDAANTVVIVSSRSTSIMDQWFGELDGKIALAAEYGAYLKWCEPGEEWRSMISNMNVNWWSNVAPLLDYYTERTPGAFIERKDSSVTWHYRDCDLDHGSWQASELLVSLREITRSLPVSVVPGFRCLEIRPQKVNKAVLFEKIWEYLNSRDKLSPEFFGEIVPSSQRKKSIIDSDIKSEESSKKSEVYVAVSDGDVNNKDSDTEPSSSATSSEVGNDDSVDFVLAIASGEDKTDEDMFSLLVPPPIDLAEYCRELEKEDLEFDSIDQAEDVSESGSNQDDAPLAKKLSESKINSSEMAGLLPRLSSQTEEFLRNKIDNDSKGVSSKQLQSFQSFFARASISENAANMFPKVFLSSSAEARRDQISEQSKFTPRKDFPPSAALIKALRSKRGDGLGMQKLPDTAAAAWALVCPPTARAKLESKTAEGKKSGEVNDDGEADDVVGQLPVHRFPVNTFVCTVGRKLSQAPYYIKNSADVFQLIQEMGLSSHIRQQRNMSTTSE